MSLNSKLITTKYRYIVYLTSYIFYCITNYSETKIKNNLNEQLINFTRTILKRQKCEGFSI